MTIAQDGNPSLHEFLQQEKDFVSAQGHAGACRDGVPGAAHEPFWSLDHEREAMHRYETGDVWGTFDTRVIDHARALCEEHGWILVEPHPERPLHIHAIDPTAWKYEGPIFQIWLKPDGSFYAGRHRSGAYMEGGAFGPDSIDYFAVLVTLGEVERKAHGGDSGGVVTRP